jgi:N-sulfoglucosamine sulfohydrolase
MGIMSQGKAATYFPSFPFSNFKYRRTKMTKKYNIVYIHSHDTGRYIQPYGYSIPTPKLQQFAEEGVLFRQAFCANPTCSPSRAALLTGQSAHSSGMWGLAHRGFSLFDYSQHILHTLRKENYYSALCGVQHIANMFENPGKHIGYDEVLQYSNEDDTSGKHAGDEPKVNAVKKFLSNRPDKPFFLSVGFGSTHREFPKGDECKVDARYVRPPEPLPDTPEIRQDMAEYMTMAEELDDSMGKVLESIKENELEDSTIVICTTDHGIAFPRMKCNLHDSGIGVMLMMKGPQDFLRGGKVIDAMVSHVDVFPTLCEMLDIEKPEWLQGKSMLPLLNGEKKSINDEIFTEVNFHAAYEPMRSVRTKRWKYIKRMNAERNIPVMPNCDNSLSKTKWYDAGWAELKQNKEMLFDLMFDPNETNNLIDKQEYSDIVQQLKDKLKKWMERTDDPFLKTDVLQPVDPKLITDTDQFDPALRKQ